MSSQQILGVLVVAWAGFIVGSGAWPMKLMKKFQCEHWWFIGMLTGLIVLPWVLALAFCPNALVAYSKVPVRTLIAANLWAAGWGIANVLCGRCFVRIGMALTGAILTGLGVSLGVTLPLVVKGSGLFKDAADVGSPAGLTVMAGVAVMLVGVVFAAFAGFGRDKALQKQQQQSGSFLGALGASLGFGIQQASQMLGNQAAGFISGEWKGVFGKPRAQMYSAIALLILAAIIMAYGNGLAKS